MIPTLPSHRTPPAAGAAMAVRVMLVDDHTVVRAGYRRLIEDDGGLQVVSEHADADSAYAALAARGGAVDVLLLDLSLPGRSGLDMLRRVRLRWPRLVVLVFSMHDSPAMVSQALKAGAAGFVTKSSEPEVLVRALHAVAAGQARVLSPDVADAPTDPAAEAPHRVLTAREFDVLHGLVEGLSIEAIAERLRVSPKTVSNYQTLIRQKLGVGTAVELLHYARAHRLFTP